MLHWNTKWYSTIVHNSLKSDNQRQLPVLLPIKYWWVRCMDHLSASSYTRVTNFQKM